MYIKSCWPVLCHQRYRFIGGIFGNAQPFSTKLDRFALVLCHPASGMVTVYLHPSTTLDPSRSKYLPSVVEDLIL